MRIIWLKIMFFIGVLVIIAGSLSYGAQDRATSLMDQDYFPLVHEALQEAKESIYAVMHIMEIGVGIKDNPAEVLVQDLIDAHQRGVKVKVILDKNLPEVEEVLGGYERVGNKNDNAYKLLKSKGLNVTFDSPDVITGSCVVVIDSYISIIGSTYWSYQGLVENFESSSMIESKEVAKVRMDYIHKIEAEIDKH